ncbi:hypothetical protein D7X25_24900 [bacterium 1XD42-8]|nr:hypothetical protein D7X25_24900 [bacterium 1XD42-8]
MGSIEAANSRLPSVRTESPRQGAKALLIERSLSKVLLRYFRESNKAEARKPRFAPVGAVKNRECGGYAYWKERLAA